MAAAVGPARWNSHRGRFFLGITAAVMLLGGCTSETEVLPRNSETDASTGECPQDGSDSVIIEWVDFFKYRGVTYTNSYHLGRKIVPDEVGSVYARVRCHLADHVTDPGYKSRSGDAAYLPVGQKMRRIKAQPPTQVLATFRQGRWAAYVSDAYLRRMDR